MPRILCTRPAVLAAGAALLMATTSASFAMTDQAFLKKAIEGDNSEVQLGLLAEKNAATPEGKAFGATLEGDHGKARIEAVKLADQMGMTAPSAATPEAMQEMEKLKQMHGPAFDKEFADYMVKDHKKDIADFKEEAESGDGPVARMARMSIPTLQKHLDMAQTLANNS